MLLPALLSLTLAAAPQAPARAEVLTFVPRLDALEGALPFFQAAGTRSGLLRPSAWRGEALPLLGVDVTSRASLEAAGLDPAGPLTVSRLDGARVSCVRVADARRFRARVDEALQRRGTRFEVVKAGVPISAARDPLDRVLAAVAIRGSAACALWGEDGTVAPLLPALAEALLKAPAGPGLAMAGAAPGVVQVVAPRGAAPFAAGLSTAGLAATVGFRAQGLAVPALRGPGASPYGGLASPGVVVARARLDPAAVPAVLRQLAAQVPGAGPALSELAAPLAPLLTGQVAALVWQVKVSTGLRTPAARFFAVKLALAAQTSDPQAAAALLAAVPADRLAVREGQLSLQVVGDSVVLANDGEARDRLVAALPGAPGPMAHGLEVAVDPPRLAAALAQVPLLEAVQAPELAGVVAAGTELGPLLLASRAVGFWLDPAGPRTHQGQLRWTLDADRLPADGGGR